MDIFFGKRVRSQYECSPITLVDVGARGGLQPNWKRAARHLRIVGFEPDTTEHARLAAATDPSRALYINAAAGREPGSSVLNVGREGGTSSLLEPNLPFLRRFPRPERFEVVTQAKIDIDRLDTLLPSNDVENSDFIKIDTQGAELSILEGASEILEKQVFGVKVEVLFAPLYNGQSSFGSVDTLLRDLGFQLFDLRRSYWKRAGGTRFGGPKGQIAFGDALYFKTEDAFAKLLKDVASLEIRRVKLLHALSISLLYGYVDYAIEIFRDHRHLLDPLIAEDINAAMES